MENSEDLAAHGLLYHVELSSGYPFSSRAGDCKLVPPLPAAVLTPGPLQPWTWPAGPSRHILSGHCAVRRRGRTASNWPTLKVKGDCVFPFPQLCAAFTALWISRASGHQNPELKSVLEWTGCSSPRRETSSTAMPSYFDAQAKFTFVYSARRLALLDVFLVFYFIF